MRFAGDAAAFVIPGCDPELDAQLESVPPGPAVFAVRAAAGEPYLARTSMLRRRLKRLLRRRESLSRLLNLRDVAMLVEYWPTSSRLEQSLVYYELVKLHYPDRYPAVLKLRMPAYVKMVLSNRFPRSQITSRLTGGAALYYGPFRTRAGAEEFEHSFLDLFQLRRCQEDLEPRPEHPGCVYGEMNMCLRPCQEAVTEQGYASEAARVTGFLSTRGSALLSSVEAARDHLSAGCDFEAAAREHKRLQRIQEVLRLSDELARDIDRLHGVAVTPANEPGAVTLWFLQKGFWDEPRLFTTRQTSGRALSLDYRLRELAGELSVPQLTLRERQEHLALLARWYYSSWRDGEWIHYQDLTALPWRKLVAAVSRIANKGETPASGPRV